MTPTLALTPNPPKNARSAQKKAPAVWGPGRGGVGLLRFLFLPLINGGLKTSAGAL